MQSYAYLRYQPGKSQRVTMSFNFNGATTNVLKFLGYSDGTDGVEFQNNGTQNQFVIYSSTANGNQTVGQSSWNLDKLNGSGPSGLTLDITKDNMLFIDFQALYVGRVRMGFVINGNLGCAHQFVHANLVAQPYIADANTPYSAVELNTAGTLSGSPAATIDSGYVAPSTKGGTNSNAIPLTTRYPITLDASGAQRLNGTLSVRAAGIGGTSTANIAVKWIEIR